MIFIVFLYFGFEIFILKIYTNAILGKLMFFLKLLAFEWILRKALLIVACKNKIMKSREDGNPDEDGAWKRKGPP